MEGVIGGVINTVFRAPVFRTKTEEKPEPDILTELQTVRRSLDTVSSRFDSVSDPDMVESCIYEMQALTSRYRYLLRQARALNLSGPVMLRETRHVPL